MKYARFIRTPTGAAGYDTDRPGRVRNAPARLARFRETVAGARCPPYGAHRRLTPHLHITSRCVLDRREHAAAGWAGFDLIGVLRLDPGDPVGPPRYAVFGRITEPPLEVLALR